MGHSIHQMDEKLKLVGDPRVVAAMAQTRDLHASRIRRGKVNEARELEAKNPWLVNDAAPAPVSAVTEALSSDERTPVEDSKPIEVVNGEPLGASESDWTNFDLILGLGDDLLPVVCDPNAKPSPTSAITDFTKVPSAYDGGLAHGFKDWPQKKSTPFERKKWSADRGLGICIITRNVRGIDCDITDAATAKRVEDFITQRIGAAPTRRRNNSSKFLIAVRVAGALPKLTIGLGTAGKIEFLGDGQQFVAAGTHKSGARITWDGGLMDDPPVLDPSDFHALWSDLAAEFGVATDSDKKGNPILGSFADAGRNNRLTSEAGKLRHAGVATDVAEAALSAMNQQFDEPLAQAEVSNIVRSIERYEVPAVAKLDLRGGLNGFIADDENVRRILTSDPDLVGMVGFDEFRNERILKRPIPDGSDVVSEQGIPRPWKERDTVALQTYIQRVYLPRIGKDRIEGPLTLVAERHGARHPIREYLQSIAWDQVPRLPTLLEKYFGATGQPAEYLAAIGSSFLISAVARIMQPGCQADSALVLEGPQGIYKSTALRTLATDEFFSDSLPADLSHKDARDHLRGKWIIELSELAQFRKSEIETVKAFLSRRTEQYRPSYGRHEVQFPRQCVFAGSTNSSDYLVDSTGNRRFWVVVCGRIDIGGIKADRDQLWAEATARYRAGEPWHLSGPVAEIAASQAQERVAHDPWTADVIIALEMLPEGEVSPGEVLAKLSATVEGRSERSAMRVAKILIDLGWRRTRRDRTRGQLFAKSSTLSPQGPVCAAEAGVKL